MAKTAPNLTFACQFKGVSVGKTTAKINVSVPRTNLTLENADNQLNGGRLNVTLTLREGTDPLFSDDHNPKLNGVAEVKGLNVKPEDIGFGLVFDSKDADLDELLLLRNQEAVVIAQRVGDAGLTPDPDDPDQTTTKDHLDD